MISLPFTLETALEHKIAEDPEWLAGVAWGKPRTGHLEGPVKFHIADVLENIEYQRPAPTAEEREALRLIALIHDAFKYRVDESRPKIGSNHHAFIARKFAERYIHDPVLLNIIELHDEAYNSWRLGARKDRWHHAEERMSALLSKLGDALPLYARFFLADSYTESKSQDPVAWFKTYLQERNYTFSFWQ
ncbi:HD domain-containing protein [Ktedonospora formicarum]|uniref:HD domain-containing protein n=1 Tax=Ktedonospora formicarum TaxID=2778364 RepID=A0A8J3HZG9_9CHLR|nr:HD domain-containing protein [Ktedonospora formicarum]GHO43492.1 hypothetical protein KSX_16550 [Ktedonospora formicarum]